MKDCPRLTELINIEYEAANEEELFGFLETEHDRIDVVMLDISLPGRGGIQILKRLRTEYSCMRVLILSVHSDAQYVVAAFRNGAVGYVTKTDPPDEVVRAIQKIMHGGRYVSSAIVDYLTNSFAQDRAYLLHENLSEREFQVFLAIAQGRMMKEIAEELSLSAKTISTYRARILEKMDMSTNADLILYAIQNDLVQR